MTVSSLKSASGEHVTVFFDDGNEILSTLTAVSEFMIFNGKELDEDQFFRFKELSVNTLALEKAKYFLSIRQMSGKELKTKLIQKGISDESADFCIDKLIDAGLLNDEAYAAAISRHYQAKGYGAGRIRAELFKRGISKDLWEDVLLSLPSSNKKLDLLIEKKLRNPEDKNEIRKLSAYLYRRGYSWEEIRSAISRFSETFDYEDF